MINDEGGRHTLLIALICSVAFIAAGCSHAIDDDGGNAVRRQQAPLAGQQRYDLSIKLPPGATLQNTALHATAGLHVEHDTTIRNASGGWPVSVNLGTQLTNIRDDVQLGDILSEGPVFLDDRVRVNGSVKSAGSITTDSGVVITGSSVPNTPIGPLQEIGFTIEFPAATRDITVPFGGSTNLPPGSYGNVDVRSSATLRLSAGKYYFVQLDLAGTATLRIDASAGPVLLNVRDQIALGGKIDLQGSAGSFFLGYFGTDLFFVNTPFQGTIVAPFAKLNLDRVGSNSHRGSFFAKEIEVDDNINAIVQEPFNFWFELFNVRPKLQCVRRFKSPNAAALFGYENTGNSVVTIPLGASNQLVPATTVTPPTDLLPGDHPKEFWAPFDINGSITWQLAGASAVANSSSPACELGDLPPGDAPQPAPPVVALERPSVPFSSVAGQLAPDVTTSAFSTTAEVYGRRTGPETGNTSNEEAGPASFTFHVTSLNFDDSEGLCGSVDPFVNKLVVDGQDFGSTRTATLNVNRERQTLHVSVDVDDDDAFLCLADDDLRDYEIDVNLYTGENRCIDGGRMCFTATAIASPDICFEWNAQFIDSGPWAGGVASEDFLPSKAVQPVPASFARYRVELSNSPSGLMFDRTGVLDENGCVPRPKLPIREHWTLGTNLKVTTRLISQFCLDPAGTDCPSAGGTFTGANVVVRPGTAASGTAASMCVAFAENLGTVTDPNCVARQINWTTVPPAPGITANFLEHNSTTRAGAIMSQLFRREAETTGGLGIRRAMIDRRLEGNGRLEVLVDTFCDTSDPCSGEILHTSCRSGSSLLLEPDGAVPSSTRFKYILAHEFGHFIQGNAQGLMAQNYGCGAGDPNSPALCRCDAVPRDQQLHCLQSLEEPNAAQIEGFAQYYAAKTFNADLESDCTFVYYKPVGNTLCMPGAASCAADATTGLTFNQPPIPVSCTQAVRWRNTNCIDAQSSADLLSHGTEWDWLEFLYDIDNVPVASTRWSMPDIFDAYVVACGGSTTTAAPCTDLQVSWAGGAGHLSLVDGAQAMADAGLKSQAAANRFRQRGNDLGVSNAP